MWANHAQAREIEVIDDGDIARWTGQHDGYASLHPSALHRRSVLLDRASRSIDIVDEIEGSHDVRIAFHFGPEVHVELDGSTAALSWPQGGTSGAARLELPSGLVWKLYRGETDPILGWYSPGLGRRVEAFALLGRGVCAPEAPLATRLEFLEIGASPTAAISWGESDGQVSTMPENRAEAT